MVRSDGMRERVRDNEWRRDQEQSYPYPRQSTSLPLWHGNRVGTSHRGGGGRDGDAHFSLRWRFDVVALWRFGICLLGRRTDGIHGVDIRRPEDFGQHPNAHRDEDGNEEGEEAIYELEACDGEDGSEDEELGEGEITDRRHRHFVDEIQPAHVAPLLVGQEEKQPVVEGIAAKGGDALPSMNADATSEYRCRRANEWGS